MKRSIQILPIKVEEDQLQNKSTIIGIDLVNNEYCENYIDLLQNKPVHTLIFFDNNFLSNVHNVNEGNF